MSFKDFTGRLQSAWFIVGVVLALLTGGYIFRGYTAAYASRDDVATINKSLADQDARLKILEEMQRRDEADRKIMQRQIFEIARSIGAPIVPGIRERVSQP